MARLVALVGRSGSGKTTACARLAEAARGAGLRVGGILSAPAPGDESGREARVARDLATGETRPLGRRVARPGEALAHWELEEATLAWGAAAVASGARAAEVLIVDELGPLELEEGGGWVTCIEALRDEGLRLAVASVRQECLEALRRRLGPDAARLEVLRLTAENRDLVPSLLLGGAT